MTRTALKHFYRRYRKVVNRIIACVVLLMAILMFWNYISDLHKHIDLLAKYNHQQSIEINNLHGEVTADQHTIDSLEQKITYITGKQSIKVQYHQTSAPKVDTIFNPMNATPTMIVTVMAIVGGIIKNLVPSF